MLQDPLKENSWRLVVLGQCALGLCTLGLCTLGLSGALGAVSASPASAQPSWDTPSSRGHELVPRSGGSVEIGFWTAGRDESRADSISGLLRLGLVLDEVFELGFTAGWAWGSLDETLNGVDTDAASASNPLVTGTYIFGEQRLRLRLGLGVTIPAVPVADEARVVAFYGGATRGLSELWMWTPDRVSLVPAFSFEAVPLDYLYLSGGLSLGVLLPTGDAPVTPARPMVPADHAEEVDLVIQTELAAGVRHDNVLGGVRMRAMFMPTFTVDQAQTSLELFLRATGRIPNTSVELFGEARFTANLDENLGFAFDELGTWGMFFLFGASTTPASIPAGRYGVRSVRFEGVEDLDELAVAACLGTRARGRFSIDVGLRGEPACGEPPFDGDHLIFDPWSWPWSEWPLFDETVFERDVERVERWYRARGYYEARVTSTEVDPPSATTTRQGAEGCGSGEGDCTVEVTFRVEEGEPVLIARMSLSGMDDLPEEMRARLRAVLRFGRDDPFDEVRFDRAKQSMLRVLADHGYAHAQVTHDIKINIGRHEAFLVFKIDAGSPNVIGRVCVSGYADLPAETIIAVANLEPADSFSLAALEETQRALYSLGVFGSVEVEPRVREEEGPAEGEEPEVEVGPGGEGEAQTEVEADADAEAAEAQADADAEADAEAHADAEAEGDTETEAATEAEAEANTEAEAEAEATESPTYCSEGPTNVPAGTEPVDIDIRVTPGRVTRIGFGVGLQAGQAVTFGTVTSFADQQNAAQWDFHFSASFEHRNLFDRLVTARLEIRPRLIFEMPVFNFTPAQDPPLGIQTTLSFRWPAFLEPRTNLILQIRHDLGPMPYTGFFRSELDGLFGPERSFFNGHLYGGFFLHGNWFVPTDRQPTLLTDRLPETGSLWLEEQIRLDLRDNPRAPTVGAYFAVSAQQSVQPLSSWDMLRVVAEARGYVPIFAGIVVAARFEIGVMEVLGHGDNLDPNNIYQYHQLGPPALHLVGGGASGNRGYLPGLLGDAEQVYVTTARSAEELARGVPVSQRPVRISGGTRSWLLSLEVRIPITREFGIVAFGDAGDVDRDRLDDPSPATFRFDHPQIAVGLGIRYQTIIGPLRLDVAVRPDELQVIGQEGSLPVTCRPDRAFNCNPRNSLTIGDLVFPGAFHLTIGESF